MKNCMYINRKRVTKRDICKYVLNRHYLSRIYLIFIRLMLEYACELGMINSSQQD